MTSPGTMTASATEQQAELRTQLHGLNTQRRWLRRAVWLVLCSDVALLLAYLVSRHGARFLTE